MSDVRNLGETAIVPGCVEPSAEIVHVGCAKPRRNCDAAECRVEPSAEIVRVGCAKPRRNCDCAGVRNPLRRSCVSDARNLGETAKLPGRVQPFADIVRVGCAVALHFWRKSRTKRSFWRLGASLLEEVSYEKLVLETWRFTFGGSLVRNARFRDKSRIFWRLGASLLEEVSYETFVLETLVRNARFGDLAILEISCETLVLETWRFTFGGSLVRNAHFGDLALQLWSWTQTWPVCSANVVRERACRSWTQKWPVICSANVVRERAFRSWTQKWPVCSTNVVRERAVRSWTQKGQFVVHM